MGIKTELDRVATRYIYYLVSKDNTVLYVGTSINPKARFKSHLKKIMTKANALIYQYINKHNISISLKVVKKHIGTYQTAEKIEIEHIIKHRNTVLNFYNNPNKKRYNKIKRELNAN